MRRPSSAARRLCSVNQYTRPDGYPLVASTYTGLSGCMPGIRAGFPLAPPFPGIRWMFVVQFLCLVLGLTDDLRSARPWESRSLTLFRFRAADSQRSGTSRFAASRSVATRWEFRLLVSFRPAVARGLLCAASGMSGPGGRTSTFSRQRVPRIGNRTSLGFVVVWELTSLLEVPRARLSPFTRPGAWPGTATRACPRSCADRRKPRARSRDRRRRLRRPS